ncbi:hypothetical protein V865_008340 [Kwoniella europaea PYCC6329]|uniref:Uncharacterized protein n=1 Tax=Kwoniella europaea PYCC6329 TaxID=1423913 RepID=A0AAX4KV61_9TREE
MTSRKRPYEPDEDQVYLDSGVPTSWDHCRRMRFRDSNDPRRNKVTDWLNEQSQLQYREGSENLNVRWSQHIKQVYKLSQDGTILEQKTETSFDHLDCTDTEIGETISKRGKTTFDRQDTMEECKGEMKLMFPINVDTYGYLRHNLAQKTRDIQMKRTRDCSVEDDTIHHEFLVVSEDHLRTDQDRPRDTFNPFASFGENGHTTTDADDGLERREINLDPRVPSDRGQVSPGKQIWNDLEMGWGPVG